MGNGIRRFEDLIAWQKARQLAREVYRLTDPKSTTLDRRLAWQLRSASTSVMANIAEGHERANRGDFRRFLGIAKASCAEVRSHLYVAIDAECLDRPMVERLLRLTDELGRVIGGLRMSVTNRR